MVFSPAHPGMMPFGLLAIVVDDFVVGDNLSGEHLLELSASVWAMRAELVDEDNLVTGMVTKRFEKPGDDTFVRSGTGIIRERDHHAIARAEIFTQR